MPNRFPSSHTSIVGGFALRFAAILFVAVCCVGCGRMHSSVPLTDVTALTTDSLMTLLLGETGPDAESRTAPTDPPLLKKGTYETVFLAADREGFARLSRGVLRPSAVEKVQKQVVEALDKNLKKSGFAAFSCEYPATVNQPKSLLVTLTPETHEAGSPKDKARGRARTMVLVILTVTDPITGKIQAQRQYYSGADASLQQADKRSQPHPVHKPGETL